MTIEALRGYKLGGGTQSSSNELILTRERKKEKNSRGWGELHVKKRACRTGGGPTACVNTPSSLVPENLAISQQLIPVGALAACRQDAPMWRSAVRCRGAGEGQALISWETARSGLASAAWSSRVSCDNKDSVVTPIADAGSCDSAAYIGAQKRLDRSNGRGDNS